MLLLIVCALLVLVPPALTPLLMRRVWARHDREAEAIFRRMVEEMRS